MAGARSVRGTLPRDPSAGAALAVVACRTIPEEGCYRPAVADQEHTRDADGDVGADADTRSNMNTSGSSVCSESDESMRSGQAGAAGGRCDEALVFPGEAHI